MRCWRAIGGRAGQAIDAYQDGQTDVEMIQLGRRGLRTPTLIITALLGSVTLALCLAGFYRNIPAVHPKPVVGDLGTYYAAATLLRQGQAENLYDYAAQDRVAHELGMTTVGIGYIYLPFFAILLQPLTLLDLPTAARVWISLNLAALFACAHLLLKVALLNARLLSTCIVFGLVLVFPPVVSDLIYGNVDILLLLLLTAATLLLDAGERAQGAMLPALDQSARAQGKAPEDPQGTSGAVHLVRRREIAAGFLIGLGVAFKFYPALMLIPIAAARRWRVVAGSLAGFGVMLGLGLVSAHGAANTFRYLSGGAPPFIIPWEPFNQSLIGALRRMLEPRLYTFPVLGLDNLIAVQAVPLLDAPLLVTPLFLLVCLVAVLITLFAFWRMSRAVPLRLQLALFLTLALVISPLVWEYYAVLVLLPFAIWLSFRQRFETSLLMLTVVTFLLTLHRYWKPLAMVGVPFWLLSFGLAALVLTWGYTIYLGWEVERETAHPPLTPAPAPPWGPTAGHSPPPR